MPAIAFINQKGGSGKTTFCDQLAWSLQARGESVRVIDLDDQQSTLFQNSADDAKWSLIDTRGALDLALPLSTGETATIDDIIETVDLVIIPFLPERDSHEPLIRVAARCEQHNCHYLIVFNKLDLRRSVDQIMFQVVCKDFPGHVATTAIHQSTVVSQARMSQKPIEEIDAKSKVAQDFAALVDEVVEVCNAIR